MQKPPTPVSRVKKSNISHTLRAVGIGAAFSGIDYLGYKLYKLLTSFTAIDPNQGLEKSQQAPLPAPNGGAAAATENKEFSKDALLKALAESVPGKIDQSPVVQNRADALRTEALKEDKMVKTRFIENFVYGTVFVKLGKEIRNIFLNDYLKSVSINNKVLMTFPIPIISYYTFCNYYEGKTTSELGYRLKNDFLLLLCFKVITATFERKAMFNFEKLTRNIQSASAGAAQNVNLAKQQEIIQSAMKKVTFSRNIISGLWIFTLTFMYKYPYYDIKSSSV